MNINKRDLSKLAVLSTKIVNSINFPDTGNTEKYCEMTLRLVEKFENKYSKDDLLLSIKDSVKNISDDTLNFYIVTRGLIRMVNEPFDFEKAKEDKLPESVSRSMESSPALVSRI